MLRYTTKILGAALVALPLAAGAAEAPEPPTFKSADANGDGSVSIKEATDAGVPKAEAEREDIDGNDQLTNADWKFVDMSPQGGQGSAGSGESSQ